MKARHYNKKSCKKEKRPKAGIVNNVGHVAAAPLPDLLSFARPTILSKLQPVMPQPPHPPDL